MADLATISVKDYFENYVPQRFASADFKEGGYTIQYEIGATTYALRVTNDRLLDVIAAGVDGPLMTIQMRESDWRDSITGRVTANVVRAEPGRLTLARLEKLRDLRGKFGLELSRDGQDPWQATAIFNGSDAPAVLLRMSADNYAALERGELNSQMAFMSGRLKFEGDIGLLMKLGSLLS